MSLTLLPVPRKYTFALDAAYTDTHRRLRQEIEEERISAELVAKHNRGLERTRTYKQNGGA